MRQAQCLQPRRRVFTHVLPERCVRHCRGCLQARTVGAGSVRFDYLANLIKSSGR